MTTINQFSTLPVYPLTRRVYESVTGFFIQDEGYHNSTPIPPHFGLLDATEHRWNNTINRLKRLNEDAEPGVAYKLIIAGRHGQGFHNVAEAKYGTKRWEEYWAKLDGDGEIVWGPDPRLTELGEDQARDAKAMWVKEREFGLPLPDALYCSPLTRALRTCQLTFANIVEFSERRPLVLENARERHGVHSCDTRSTKSQIHASFPEFKLEEGFTEEDELADPNVRETDPQILERAYDVLNRIFQDDKGLVISVTTHDGFIRGLVTTMKHSGGVLPTGGVLPMVVKGTIIEK